MAFTNLADSVSSIEHHPWQGFQGKGYVANYIWSNSLLDWVKQTSSAGTSSTEVNVTNTSLAVTVSSLPLPSGAATEATLASLLAAIKSSTSTLSNVSASASSVTVLASNSSRKGATFYNDSTSICYLKFGATASTTSFTQKMAAGDSVYIEGIPIYTGVVDAIWASATGIMCVTELT